MGSFIYQPGGYLLLQAGCSIYEAAREAVVIAQQRGRTVHYNIRTSKGEQYVYAAPDSDPKLLIRDIDRALDGCTTWPVGPYPVETLSAKVQAKDARIIARLRRKANRRGY
jgi:hypothetical protein